MKHKTSKNSFSAIGTGARILERNGPPEPVFLNVYGAQESIPRHQLRQPMYYVAWRAGTITLFLLGA